MQNPRFDELERETVELNYADVKRDVAERLKRSCADWAPKDFEAIVEKVTQTTMKYPAPRRFLAD